MSGKNATALLVAAYRSWTRPEESAGCGTEVAVTVIGNHIQFGDDTRHVTAVGE